MANFRVLILKLLTLLSKKKSIYLKLVVRISILAALLTCSACTHFFFQPNQTNYLKGINIPFPIEEVTTKTAEGYSLTHWLLKPEKPKGLIFFLHGNAQNISAHIRSVAWLVQHGYLVYMFEYRGYITPYKPSLEDSISDVQLALKVLINDHPQIPIYVFGQSLGGSIAITSVAKLKEKDRLCAVISEAAFTSYEAIAEEKLSEVWITRLLKTPLSKLYSSKYDAQSHVAKLSPLPLLIIHSPEDKIVPFRHSKVLYDMAKMPKSFLHSEGEHIATFQNQAHRKNLLAYLKAQQCKTLPQSSTKPTMLHNKSKSLH